ncbi:unnamed protein product [Moneuplotes crassus]|uniref:Uncharacterized protein n=1 Tax=Euplotes crassus TaxID=5936 RepID=A0AAD1UJJ5_EUPCR|nr:unnamed protein product [Moneuplotes crassus]
MFSLVNQFQLYILLPMLPISFPSKVAQFILGTDFSFVSFDFIPVGDIPLVEQVKEAVDYPQGDAYLDEVGLTSNSSLADYLPMMMVIVLVSLLHLGVLLVHLSCAYQSKHKRCKALAAKLFEAMTFGFYIRLVMEYFMFQMLSIVCELKAFKHDPTVATVSLVLCLLFGVCMFVFISLVVWSYIAGCKNPGSEFHTHLTTSELYSGIKHHTLCKANSLCFLAVRLASILVIVLMQTSAETDAEGQTQNVTSLYYIKLALMLVVHVMLSVFVFVCRPYDSTANNIVESIHQLNYMCALVPLLFLHFQSDWLDSEANLYIYLLLLGPTAGVMVNVFSLVTALLKKCASKASKSKGRIKNLRKPTTIQPKGCQFTIPCKMTQKPRCMKKAKSITKCRRETLP